MADPRDVPSSGVSRPRFTAPAYPFGATVGAVFGGSPDVAVVVTSITNILTTAKGSVPYDPNMGSVAPLLLFEPLDEITISLLRYYTYKDLSEQEPRILVRHVYAERPPQDEHTILVQVGFSLVGDPEGRVFGAPVRFDPETSIGGI